MDATRATQNYLETIYILTKKNGEVRAIDICTYLNYSRPTVSVALKQMKENGLVDILNNRIVLTEEGMEIARSMYDRHYVIAHMLMGLGVSEKTALEDACKIEHEISEESFECMKRHYAVQKK